MASVLVVGSGGREHAIIAALAKSSKVDKIFAAPGNAGISKQAKCINIKDNQIEELVLFAKENKIDLTIVGPEASLALGIVDAFRKEDLKIFGPTKEATKVESSKEFAKVIMEKYNIPTAKYRSFSDFEEAKSYVLEKKFPIVLKYDGLAAGKGVIIAYKLEEAIDGLKDMLLDDRFGHGSVVIEDYLEGPEFSFMCLVDNENVYPLEMAQDHKRAYDNDLGPNTGGMGAYSPVPFITEEDKEFAYNQIMVKMAKAMVAEGIPFTGVLYGGLMKTEDGIKVIEFNARFGDPETEVVLPRLKSDIYEVFTAVLNHETPNLEWVKDSCIGVVLASTGYPGSYEKGFVIKGLVDDDVYHMGTAFDENGNYVTNGGRVLFVTAMAEDLALANKKALKLVDNIFCVNLFHRTDIGAKVLKK